MTVADIMDAEPVTIPAELTVAHAYDEFFLRYQGWPWFAVVEDDGRFAGLVLREAVAGHGGGRDRRSASSPPRRGPRRRDDPLEALLASEPLRRVGALMAVDADGRLRGVVTLEQVSRALQARCARLGAPDQLPEQSPRPGWWAGSSDAGRDGRPVVGTSPRE